MNSEIIPTKYGQSIYYESHGHGRPLVLLMGIGYDSSLWHLNQVPAFKEHFQTILIDNRDSGRSGQANGPYEISDMADDVVSVLDHLSIDKANIAGLSMGGMIAQNLAVRHQERVDHLVLSGCGCAPALTMFDPISVWNFVKQSDASGVHFAAQQMMWLFSETFNRDLNAVKDTLDLLSKNPNPMTNDGYNRQADAYLHFNQLESLNKITAQTLMLCGSRDKLTPPWVCKEVADGIPNALFSVVDSEHASHVLPLEMPEEFNKKIMKFLH